MRSTSSPNSSILSGTSLSVGKMSVISPLTAYWPLPSTLSVRVYPASSRNMPSSLWSTLSPLEIFLSLERYTLLGIVRRQSASTEQQMTSSSPFAALPSTESLAVSSSLEAPSTSRRVISLEPRASALAKPRVLMSCADRKASASLAKTAMTCLPVFIANAAAHTARCILCAPKSADALFLPLREPASSFI